MSGISLLREKFTIRERDIDGDVTIALGNRLAVPLSKTLPPLIIRAHSMHIALRYGAEILRQLSYISHIENIETFVDWQEKWDNIIKAFETEHTPQTWVCVYFKGKPIFQTSRHHMFFDVIEQCEYQNQHSADNYEKSILMAQRAFKQMGKPVSIDQESHVGFVLDDGEKELRFAIILRTPEQKATFIARMSMNDDVQLTPRPFEALQLGADYIEGINLAVRSGFMESQIAQGSISKYSDEMKKYQSLQRRLGKLDMSIAQAERRHTLKYRPEKPDLKLIQKQCKDAALL